MSLEETVRKVRDSGNQDRMVVLCKTALEAESMSTVAKSQQEV